jgi:ADP-ribose pyrophosphatase YjhB (NUDIX family)
MNEEIFAKGRLFELVHTTQPDGRVFEVARRAPGVRLIISDTDTQKLLLTKEFRHELNDWDYRLPGGKVFNTLDDYEAFRKSGKEIMKAAEAQAKNEALEEAGVTINELKFVRKSALGATVEWDLYVFEATKWELHKDGQHLKEDEPQDIVSVDFYDYSEVKRMILSGQIQEERIALILLQWLGCQEKSNE